MKKINKFFSLQKKLFMLAVFLYLIIIILLCFLFKNAFIENGKIVYSSSLLISIGVFSSLLVVDIIVTLFYSLISYFKKGKKEKVEKVTDSSLNFNAKQSKEYKAYFYEVLLSERKDLFFLFIHSILFPLYTLIMYYQLNIDNKMKYTYLLLVASCLIILMFLLNMFIVPLNKRRTELKKNITYKVNDYMITYIIENNEIEIGFNSIIFAKETKHSFIFVINKMPSIIISKEDLSKEAINFLSKKTILVKGE